MTPLLRENASACAFYERLGAVGEKIEALDDVRSTDTAYGWRDLSDGAG